MVRSMNHRIAIVMAASALALTSCGSGAEKAAEAPAAAPAAPAPPAAPTVPDYPELLNNAAKLDAFIVQAAQLAATNAARNDVKAYAVTALGAHANATQQLGDVTEPVGLGRPASDLSIANEQRLQVLAAAHGPAFDALYLDLMLAALQGEIDRQRRFVDGHEPQPVATWATANANKLQRELEAARGLKRALPGADLRP